MPHLKSTIQLRLDKIEKEETFAIFEKIGITPAHAIRQFLRYIREHREFPFPIDDATDTGKRK